MVNSNGVTPCAKCPKIPSEVFDDEGKTISKTVANLKLIRPHAAEVTPRMAEAFQHYRECKAVGQFPDDPIVRANAVQFRDAEDQAHDDRQARREERLMEIASAIAKRRK